MQVAFKGGSRYGFKTFVNTSEFEGKKERNSEEQ
jgi:hypothetical protein